jgi:hypothetical protein
MVIKRVSPRMGTAMDRAWRLGLAATNPTSLSHSEMLT